MLSRASGLREVRRTAGQIGHLRGLFIEHRLQLSSEQGFAWNVLLRAHKADRLVLGTITVQRVMVFRPVFPELVDEVLVFEGLVEIGLLPRVGEVQALLERIVEVEVGRDRLLEAILGGLLESLKNRRILPRHSVALLGELRVVELVLLVSATDVVVDFALALVYLFHHSQAKVSLPSVRYVVQVVEMDQVRVAELRSLRAFSGGPSLLLLHLLQDGHLYQYLIDLVLGEALEDIRALGVIQRLLRRSLLLKVLKVAYTILLNVYVLPECIRHALRTLVLCLSEQLLWIELGLRLGNAPLRAA